MGEIIVPPYGPPNAKVAIIGEAPGKQEAAYRRPFVGPTGIHQARMLGRGGVRVDDCWLHNVIPEYTPGNPDPTIEQIVRWTPRLESQVASVGPEIIVAVGGFAARWFLGEEARLERVHGLPHEGGTFDVSVRHRACGAVVVPVYHPAAGIRKRDAGGRVLQLVEWDYARVCEMVRGLPARPHVPRDEYPSPTYVDVSGAEMAEVIRKGMSLGGRYDDGIPRLALDTEGEPGYEWSLQIAHTMGEGYVCRCAQGDFEEACGALQDAANDGARIYIQNRLWDEPLMRGWGELSWGVDISQADIWDPMYAAYLLRREALGEKALAWRWCRVAMRDYLEVVGDSGRQRQVEYLTRVMAGRRDGDTKPIDLPPGDKSFIASVVAQEWAWLKQWKPYPRPAPSIVEDNDGTIRRYQPQSPSVTARAIVRDVLSGKTNKHGEPTDPRKRWTDIDWRVRVPVERELGEMPRASLDDVPLEEAIEYAGRDPDVLLRIGLEGERRIREAGLEELMAHGMAHMPYAEQCQWNGMRATRRAFVELSEDMQRRKREVRERLSNEWLGGCPINPASSPQVRRLLIDGLGFKALKRTASGEASTAQDSIGHLEGKHEAIDALFEWRKVNTIDTRYAQPGIRQCDLEGKDYINQRCRVLLTRIPTRRWAAKDPNQLAVPSRDPVGRRVRGCYEAPEGHVYYAADLSQIELRDMADESGDELLISRFIKGEDLHTATAMDMLGCKAHEVTGEQRSAFKSVGFGIPYGFGPHGLWLDLKKKGIDAYSEDDCKRLIADYLKLYKGVAAYIEAVKDAARRHPENMSVDRWGMRNYFPGLLSEDDKTRAEDERAVFSYRIQGGAQGMIQNSTRWLMPHLRRIQERELEGTGVTWLEAMRGELPMAVMPRLQIHDELDLTVREDLVGEVDRLVLEALTCHHGATMRVPVLAESNWGRTWEEAK